MKDKNQFWKRKLMAYLHDPPHKPLDISRHEDSAWKLCLGAGMTDDDYEIFKKIKDVDHTSSAADRFPFPKNKCTNSFDGTEGKTFRHPLSGSEYEFQIPSWELADELLKYAVGGIHSESQDKEEKWKQIFFLHWRRWLDEVVKIGNEGNASSHFAYFPADTRIPDHTIWSHMAVTSALQGCRDDNMEIKPAFLLFNLGPVQEFIAQARSTRDLWSGSYMLSWLTAHAVKTVTDANGPDSIIFPSLRGIGIFDVLYRDELYSKIRYKGKYETEDTLWERMYSSGDKKAQIKSAEKLLNPVFPNRFLAIVPADRAEKIAKDAEQAVVSELKIISTKVWARFTKLVKASNFEENPENWKKRWDKQVDLFSQISWQIMPWEETIEKALEKYYKLPADKAEKSKAPYENLSDLYKFITESIPESDKDVRYYIGEKKEKLNNTGFVWSANYAMTDYALSARRNTRNFEQFITDDNQFGTPKDTLSGKEEIIGSEKLWSEIGSEEKGSAFKANEGSYGALNVIKRLWWRNDTGYLLEKLGIRDDIFRNVMKFESVPDIACGNYDGAKTVDGEDKPNNPYVAVLAMDGDSMGKWISGSKTPKLLDVIGEKAQNYFREHGIDENLKRPLTPSYHLQFSKALANFANHVAGKVVDKYNGQLIYAGGDDVLAILPADKALKCARALRACFRGDKDALPEREREYELAIKHEGFLSVGEGMELIVPGLKADVSCGIAVAHCKHPLQHIIEEARIAEKRAKNEYGRSAFAMTLIKRSGEKNHWGAKWNSTAIELYITFMEDQKQSEPKISGRFPYALAEFLFPYKLNEPDCFEYTVDKISEIIKSELSHVCEQQKGKSIQSLCEKYLKELASGIKDSKGRLHYKLDDLVNLFLAASFIKRGRG